MDLVFAATLTIAMTGGSGGWDPYEITTDPRRVRSEAVELLVRQLSDPKKARSAARRLVRFGRTAIPALRRALSSGDLSVRYYAASALALMTDREAARILLRVLADGKEPPLIRRIAAGAVSRAGCRESIPVLVRLARRTYRAADPAASSGHLADPTDRAASSGHLADPTDRAASSGHLADPTDRARRDLGGDEADAAGNARDKADDKASEVAGDGDDPLAGASGERFRYEVVKALAYMGAAEADRIVTAALADPSPRIRQVAAQGLGDHRVPGAVAALRAALADPDAGVVCEAAKALGKFGRLAAPATGDLVGLLDCDDIRLRRAARGALVPATGNSFSSAERWRAWWNRRQERLAAERQARRRRVNHRACPPGDGDTEGTKRTASSSRDAQDVQDVDGSRPADPARPRSTSSPGSGGTPPALRPPWEWDDEDWTETREP